MTMTSTLTEQQNPLIDEIIDVLRQIYDPEIPVNIYDLGLIYRIDVYGLTANIEMTLTTPNCPVAESMPQSVEEAVKSLDQIDEAIVTLTWDPPWRPELLSDEIKLELGLM
ncbi:MAG: iron-sulfur cluster assembly protein [Gammaproteobacteria bacterium]|nr:iron-sulfur cluster assembly protein [Gammaproteobacteria bacterium]